MQGQENSVIDRGSQGVVPIKRNKEGKIRKALPIKTDLDVVVHFVGYYYTLLLIISEKWPSKLNGA